MSESIEVQPPDIILPISGLAMKPLASAGLYKLTLGRQSFLLHCGDGKWWNADENTTGYCHDNLWGVTRDEALSWIDARVLALRSALGCDERLRAVANAAREASGALDAFAQTGQWHADLERKLAADRIAGTPSRNARHAGPPIVLADFQRAVKAKVALDAALAALGAK